MTGSDMPQPHHHPLSRREAIRCAAAAGAAWAAASVRAAEATPPHVRANTDWLAACRYGVGLHWTAQSVPPRGEPARFAKAVDALDVRALVDRLVYAGADYLLFTSCHALQMLPAPHPVLDRILPGRTCRRDLIGELADALAAKGLRLLVYYNHSCNGGQDPAWERAVGYHAADKRRFAGNLMDIVGWMGDRYRDRIKAWWFDSPYSLDRRGPHNSVTTDLRGFLFPWEEFTVAAKRGFRDRLVTYNAGVAETYLYTTHQNYWAGELVDLNAPPKGRYHTNGLQWFGWTCLEDRAWVQSVRDRAMPPPLYSDEQLLRYVRACNAHRAPMTFNVGVYQTGELAEKSIEQLHRLGRSLGKGGK